MNEQDERLERRALESRKALRREERRLERADEGLDESEHSVGEDDECYIDSDEDVATMVSWLSEASSFTGQFILFYSVFVPSRTFKAYQRQESRCSQVESPSHAIRTQTGHKQCIISHPGPPHLSGNVTTP